LYEVFERWYWLLTPPPAVLLSAAIADVMTGWTVIADLLSPGTTGWWLLIACTAAAAVTSLGWAVAA
jgi:hypothetical protein